MEIKKSTLRLAIPIVIVLTIISVVAISSAVKKSKEDRERQEFRADIERAIDREYRSLKREFDYYAESYFDSYSSYAREHALGKMRQLTGLFRSSSYISRHEIEMQKDEIDKALRAKATDNVINGMLGE